MLRIADSWHGSDLGLQRQGNEDNYFVRAPLFVVADGMGGAQSGEVASEMAVEAFGAGAARRRLAGRGPACSIIESANRRIHERSRAEPQRAGMGTTVTAAYVGEDAVTIAHVGDSRCYLRPRRRAAAADRRPLARRRPRRLGKLTEEQAETHPQRSVITRALGPEPNVQVDVEAFEATAGDLFLVCSDGLTSMVREDRSSSRCWSANDAAAGRARARADRRRQRRRRARQHHRRSCSRSRRSTRRRLRADAPPRRRDRRGHARVRDLQRARPSSSRARASAGRRATRATPTRRARPSARGPRARDDAEAEYRSLGHRRALGRAPARAADRGRPRPRPAAASAPRRRAGGCSRPAS